jgi:nicotinamidase-related amidase
MKNFEQSAVLVINLQVDFCSLEGFAAKLGREISPIRVLLPKMKTFLKIARQNNLPIVFCQYIARKGLSPQNMRINQDREERARMCLLNSRGSELYGILPKNGERVIKHCFYDIFAQTELKALLSKLGVKTLLITGVRTELSVDATAKRAISEGFEVVILKDLVGTYAQMQPIQRRLLEVFDRYYGHVMSWQQVEESFE